MFNHELPRELQAVEITLDGHDWQRATYVRGGFVDLYGLPLDRQKISDWRAIDTKAGENSTQPARWYRRGPM